MTRRAILMAAIVAVLPAAASADEAGTRRQRRDDRRCRRIGAALGRGGMTRADRRRMARQGCVEVSGEWTSDRVYAA